MEIETTPGATDKPRMTGYPPFDGEAVKLVLNYVGRQTRIQPDEILAKGRGDLVVKARWMAMYLLRTEYGWGLTTIGKAMNRDHSTVSHALRTFKKEMDENYGFKTWANQIIAGFRLTPEVE